MKKFLLAATCLVALWATGARAQLTTKTVTNCATPGGVYTWTNGKTGQPFTIDLNGVVCTSGSLPAGAATSAKQDTGNASLATIASNTAGPYPNGATPITASATGTTGATTATLAGTSGKTTYICSLAVRSNATAAATGNVTVTGTVTGTLNYTHWTAPNASGIGLTEEVFIPCAPASATNTAIAVVSPAPGTGGVVSVTALGFQL